MIRLYEQVNVQLMNSLTREQIEECLSYAILRHYPKNTVLFQEGDESNALRILLSGRVKVYLSNEAGKEIILSFLKSGDHFGEASLVSNLPHFNSVMTLEKSCIATIKHHEFEKLMLRYPVIALNFLKSVAGDLRLLTDNIRSLALMDVYGRVTRLLMNCAKPVTNGSSTFIIEEPMTHQDLANRVGASREMITRILKDLSRGGYIFNKGKKIIINNRLPE